MKNIKRLKIGDKFSSKCDLRNNEPVIECIKSSLHFASFKWLNNHGSGSFVLDKKTFNESLWELVI